MGRGIRSQFFAAESDGSQILVCAMNAENLDAHRLFLEEFCGRLSGLTPVTLSIKGCGTVFGNWWLWGETDLEVLWQSCEILDGLFLWVGNSSSSWTFTRRNWLEFFFCPRAKRRTPDRPITDGWVTHKNLGVSACLYVWKAQDQTLLGQTR